MSLPTDRARSVFASWPEREEIERGLFELSQRGVLLTRPNGSIAACNPAVARILGYGPEELTGIHFNTLTHPEDAHVGITVIQDIIAGKGNSLVIEKRYLRKDGSVVWVRLHVTGIRNDEGEVVLFVSAVDDLSEERLREQERRLAIEKQTQMQAQVIAAQRQALRELSTPLIPIRDGVVAVPLIGAIDSERAHQILETILTGTAQHQCTTLIVDISGVPTLDDDVAGLLLRMTGAVRLLGAEILLSGIRPEVAQRFVSSGIDLAGLKTAGSFQSAIALALNKR